MKTYHCDSCGARIITHDNERFTTCMYCGNTIAFVKEGLEKLDIQKMIPFSIDKEEVIEKFGKILKKKVVAAHKIYLPVRFCQFKFHFLYNFQHRYTKNGDDAYTFEDLFTFLDGEATNDIIFGDSHIQEVFMIDEVRKRRRIPFDPEALKDVSIEYCEFDQRTSYQELENRVHEYSLEQYEGFYITDVYNENYSLMDVQVDPYLTLIPVYVIQTEDHFLYNISGVKIDKIYQQFLFVNTVMTVSSLFCIVFILLLIFSKFKMVSIACLFFFMVVIGGTSQISGISYFQNTFENYRSKLHKSRSNKTLE